MISVTLRVLLSLQYNDKLQNKVKKKKKKK